MRRSGRKQRGAHPGKILRLHKETREDAGLIAPLLLAALGREETEDEDEDIRATVGAIHMAEAALELRAIRQILVKVFSSKD